MKIQILTFGIARDIIGHPTLPMELPEGSTVADVRMELTVRYPAFQKLQSVMIAVNTEYASAEIILNENDEVAIIPPVSGG